MKRDKALENSGLSKKKPREISKMWRLLSKAFTPIDLRITVLCYVGEEVKAKNEKRRTRAYACALAGAWLTIGVGRAVSSGAAEKDQ